jgi:fucose permease
MGLGCSAIYPTLLAAASNKFPHFTATVFGILISIGGLGGIVQPLVMGAVADVSTGMKPVLAVCIVPLLIVFTLQVVLIRVDKRKGKETQKEQ